MAICDIQPRTYSNHRERSTDPITINFGKDYCTVAAVTHCIYARIFMNDQGQGNLYKKRQRNLICRVCRKEVETQQHILEECVELHEDVTTKVNKDDIFKEDEYHLKEIANKRQKTMDKLTQIKA